MSGSRGRVARRERAEGLRVIARGRALVFAVAALVLAPFAGACAPGYRHVIEHALPSSDTLACDGFLVWNNEPVRDVWLVINGSGNRSNAFVHPSLREAIRAQPVAYATYDKPGIRAPFGDPAQVRREPERFERYTLGHGIACATNALRWTRERFGPSVRLHLRGHSEGSLVALYTYDALLEQHDPLASAVATLVLSGLALEPFAEILERQLAEAPNGARQRAALAACDWKVLQTTWGISCSYVADAKGRPSGRVMFERLATRGATARFYVFHGEHDWNTPVAPVRQLEAWHATDRRLRLQFRYYEGGHAGSEAARATMQRSLTEIVSEGGAGVP